MNTPNNAAALLPCPFCGSNSIDPKGWASANSAGPSCDDCGASAGNVSNNLADNIAAWNTRATPAQPDALTVRIAHKGPSDFPNHQCPGESSAVWNACCMEHERVLAGKVPMLTTTALTSHPSGEAVAWPERMVNLPCPDGTTDRIVGFRVEEGGQILGKFGLSEPIAWLRSVTVDRHTHPSADAPKRPDPSLCAHKFMGNGHRCLRCGWDFSTGVEPPRSADAPGEAVGEWRPIESAPAGVPILVRYINRAGKERVIKARFIQRFTEESSGDCDEGVDEYDEANDRYTYCEGWWEMIDNWDDFAFIAVSEGSPTHWHKIPSTAALAPKPEGEL